MPGAPGLAVVARPGALPCSSVTDSMAGPMGHAPKNLGDSSIQDNSRINTRLHSEIGGRSFFSRPYTCALKGAEWCEHFRLWSSSLLFLSLPRLGSTPIG